MMADAVIAPTHTSQVSLPQAVPLLNWCIAYTLPRHERRVAEQIVARGLQSYLPLYETLRRWTDRRVKVEFPLFPGYVFVRLQLAERVHVLELPGVLRFVSFQGRPATLDAAEIESLRHTLTLRKAEPYRYLAGKRVRFRGGAFDGLEGVIVRRKHATRVVVSIDSIQRSISIEADGCDLECIA